MNGVPRPQAYLELSRKVLVQRDPRLAGVWPRASAFLARQAVEAAITDALQRRAPGAERATSRARLLCLTEYVPTDLARRASFIWGSLSRVCHHHPYELAPTASELEGWIAEAEGVSVALHDLPTLSVRQTSPKALS
jgi:hypothetical protein